ncbi:MAG: Holliday junction branch migration DNA helicase RuvB [Candidatus Brocadia sp.]|jgi:Holliday junction DNA helicase RuvB|nr:Holliday junction branch migration DNA helicase RuvB [Candidatus Brocadia sp.]MCE7910566.1 Holliday junction branch migration DNA helicase RuvB [Candidatus Brocadia sp. AMX3]MDG5996688.1 Holliday junction branch migration DNA helicase RuvB [Candidatus Brocadia sp.]OQZ00056.1 MAG: Holliday junction branch migration DNA helicase RuvB [Candidatus Brocadia sp. UTAMX2]RIK01452.1 MAG: Holliday junction branch migration DNA helicase RuvB [Candidatus Brocadia sp.]
MIQEDILSSAPMDEDKNLDCTLRPKRFRDFIGQDRIKENLLIYIEAAKKRAEPLDHILFSGPPGLGKTTLSQIIANEINASIKTTSGPILDKPMDLAGILTNLQPGDILFIDEIHRLNTTVEEYLYSAMEDFYIDILIDQGPKARSVKINLPKFTLVGSTTREGLLTAPLRSRFGVLEKLEFYPWTDLYKVVCNSAQILSIHTDEKGAEIIAKRSRGTPRIANRFLRRIRDVAQVRGNDIINEDIARMGLQMLGVDENGLGEMDRKILETLIRYGGPVGLKTIAVSVSEEEDTIEEVYESYLIQRGYLDKTPRGRVATKLAYEHLGFQYRSETGIQKRLF